MAVFEDQVVLSCAPESLFDFLLRPANVQRISDPSMGLTIVEAPEIVEPGSELDFQFMTFGQVVKAKHKITDITRPHTIIEEQIQGPLQLWRHEHHFESHSNGVLMRDVIEFELPGGILGMLLKEETVIGQLEDGFLHRQTQLSQLISQGEI